MTDTSARRIITPQQRQRLREREQQMSEAAQEVIAANRGTRVSFALYHSTLYEAKVLLEELVKEWGREKDRRYRADFENPDLDPPRESFYVQFLAGHEPGRVQIICALANMRLRLTDSCYVPSGAPQTCTVPAASFLREFNSAFRSAFSNGPLMSGVIVFFEIQDEEAVLSFVVGGDQRGRIKIAQQVSQDFAFWRDISGERISNRSLMPHPRFIQQSKHCVPNSDYRDILNGFQVHRAGDQFVTIGTNGWVMARKDYAIPEHMRESFAEATFIPRALAAAAFSARRGDRMEEIRIASITGEDLSDRSVRYACEAGLDAQESGNLYRPTIQAQWVVRESEARRIDAIGVMPQITRLHYQARGRALRLVVNRIKGSLPGSPARRRIVWLHPGFISSHWGHDDSAIIIPVEGHMGGEPIGLNAESLMKSIRELGEYNDLVIAGDDSVITEDTSRGMTPVVLLNSGMRSAGAIRFLLMRCKPDGPLPTYDLSE